MNQPIFDPPFRDPALSTGERVDDLLGRLTLEEKLGLLHRHQAPVDRLGLRAFHTGTQALHGVALHGVVHSAPATVFPQAIGLASTWNPDLVRRVGDAVGDEVVAFHRKNPAVASRNVWAPVVNPLRDPRWGRNEEGYSEDPWLTGVMGTAYALGQLEQCAAEGAARVRAQGLQAGDRNRRGGGRHAVVQPGQRPSGTPVAADRPTADMGR
jgi:beta-glucosidase